ncbi:MAG: bifunctional DNA primase/polymerase [Oligoflexia bacterium]|nr:bifunctional DNA primase/polymerase [Oligoflexia bacterium]
MSQKLQNAIKLSEKGFYVFPIKENEKFPPLFKNYAEKATRNKDEIIKNWTEHPNANIGIYAGKFRDSAMVVVDVDKKNGKNGYKSLSELKLSGVNFSDTFSQSSPSGGEHLFYISKSTVRQSVSKLGVGLDIRSEGGYVLGAGSTINDKPYSIKDDLELAEIPDELFKRLLRNKPKINQKPLLLPNIDIEATNKRAIQYLKNDAPLAIEGAGGDVTTFIVAAYLKDLGVSIYDAGNLMSEYWNNRCHPPWHPIDLLTKVINAYRYGQNEIGSANPQVVFDSVAPDVKHSFLPFELLQNIKPILDQQFLVKDLILKETIGMIFGDSNVGKTFFALDLAVAVSLGESWFGQKVKKGACVYVCLEGSNGIRNRLEAIKKNKNLLIKIYPLH